MNLTFSCKDPKEWIRSVLSLSLLSNNNELILTADIPYILWLNPYEWQHDGIGGRDYEFEFYSQIDFCSNPDFIIYL